MRKIKAIFWAIIAWVDRNFNLVFSTKGIRHIEFLGIEFNYNDRIKDESSKKVYRCLGQGLFKEIKAKNEISHDTKKTE